MTVPVFGLSPQVQSAATGGAPVVQRQATNYVWATTVLEDANLPTTPGNVANVVRWMTNENPASNWWNRNNPLNASLNTSATDGTGSYPSLTIAAQNTAAMIMQSNMAPIYNALAANASPTDFGNAVISSPWAESHYTFDVSRFTGPNPPTVSATGTVMADPASGTGGGAGSTPDSSGGGCNGRTDSGGVDIFGAHIGTICNIKALTGGLLVGLGGFTLLVGAALIASHGLSHTGVGRAATRATGQASRAVSRGKSSRTTPAPTLSDSDADHYEQEATITRMDTHRRRDYNAWKYGKSDASGRVQSA